MKYNEELNNFWRVQVIIQKVWCRSRKPKIMGWKPIHTKQSCANWHNIYRIKMYDRQFLWNGVRYGSGGGADYVQDRAIGIGGEVNVYVEVTSK